MSTVLQDIVAKKHYLFISGAGLTWQQAVKASTASLVADGSVSKDFYKQIIACIEKYGPYMVFEHNIAMPHTTENAEGVYKTGIGFMVTDQMIDFGVDEDGEKKEANIFFTLCAANSAEHMNNIQQLASIFMNEPLIDALVAARTPEEILAAEEKYPCEEE